MCLPSPRPLQGRLLLWKMCLIRSFPRRLAVFNGKGSFGCPAYPPVSDHFGVLAETGRGETFSGTEGDRASAAGASIARTKITCTNENKSE